jgi:hypothetical protein
LEIAQQVNNFLIKKKTKNIVNEHYFANFKKHLWQPYDKVVFDCDSTLTKIEGIDELAKLKGKYKAVKTLTNKAMCGLLNFKKTGDH